MFLIGLIMIASMPQVLYEELWSRSDKLSQILYHKPYVMDITLRWAIGLVIIC